MADSHLQEQEQTIPKQKTGAQLRQLWESGEPVLLTINGGTPLTVEDSSSYQKLLELVEYLETVAAIREGMQEIEEGKGMSLDQAKDTVRRKYGISL